MRLGVIEGLEVIRLVISGLLDVGIEEKWWAIEIHQSRMQRTWLETMERGVEYIRNWLAIYI